MLNILLTLTIPVGNTAIIYVWRGIPNHVLAVRHADCMPITTKQTTEPYAIDCYLLGFGIQSINHTDRTWFGIHIQTYIIHYF